jgi:exopolysaccharide production protein ExoZ
MAIRLTNLQIVRGLAALFVVLSHAAFETRSMTAALGLPPLVHETALWTAAVDVFFVMSGFILLYMGYGQFAKPGASAEFFVRRLVRAVPLYWALTTIVLVGGWVLPSLLNVRVTDPLHVLSSYLFWPYPRGEGELRPVLALGWTMNLEFMFYAVLALAMALPLRWGVAFATAVLAGFVAWANLAQSPPVAVTFWGSAMTLDFILGFAIAIAFHRGVRLTAPVGAIACVAALAVMLLVATPEPGGFRWFFVISIPAALIVAAAVLAPQAKVAGTVTRAGVLLGDACYSIYLLQPFVLRPAAVLWTALVGKAVSVWVYVGVAAAAALCGGLLCYLLFEKPLTSLLNRRVKAWEQRRRAASGALQAAE